MHSAGTSFTLENGDKLTGMAIAGPDEDIAAAFSFGANALWTRGGLENALADLSRMRSAIEEAQAKLLKKRADRAAKIATEEGGDQGADEPDQAGELPI